MFIDTSILIEIISHGKNSPEVKRVLKIVKDHPLYISILQLGEYSDWCHRRDKDPGLYLPKIKKLVNVVNVTEDICLEGSRIKWQQRKKGQKKFSLTDGIITATARSINIPILTMDRDFHIIEDAIVLDKFK